MVETKSSDNQLEDLHSDFFPPLQIVWRNVAFFAFIHAASLAALILIAQGHFQWNTLLWAGVLHVAGGFGITGGAHRLWAHKSQVVQGDTPTQNIPRAPSNSRLSMTLPQTSILDWCRDHRVHHKYTDTHADPHNAQRGLFFSHIGWTFTRKHPLVKQKGQSLDMSDLENDPVVMFQKRHYLKLVSLVYFLIPSAVPCFFWGESFLTSWLLTTQLRYCVTLHITWLINSAAHAFGSKPYDKHIKPVENTAVSVLALGEGYHNYHHTFPYDYKASELGLHKFNFTTSVLNLFARAGLAYDLKSVNHEVIVQRASRTGDGSHSPHLSKEHSPKDNSAEGGRLVGGPWGWGDSDIPSEDIEATETLFFRKKRL